MNTYKLKKRKVRNDQINNDNFRTEVSRQGFLQGLCDEELIHSNGNMH